MNKFHFVLAPAVLLFVSAFLQTPAAAQNGAVVFNHPGGTWASFTDPDNNDYFGPATLVINRNGIRGQANTRLTDGSPVAETTRFTMLFSSPFGLLVGRIVLTPSGNANVHFYEY